MNRNEEENKDDNKKAESNKIDPLDIEIDLGNFHIPPKSAYTISLIKESEVDKEYIKKSVIEAFLNHLVLFSSDAAKDEIVLEIKQWARDHGIGGEKRDT